MTDYNKHIDDLKNLTNDIHAKNLITDEQHRYLNNYYKKIDDASTLEETSLLMNDQNQNATKEEIALKYGMYDIDNLNLINNINFNKLTNFRLKSISNFYLNVDSNNKLAIINDSQLKDEPELESTTIFSIERLKKELIKKKNF